MKAKFKVGDRVAIKNPHFRENRVEFGTIVYAPKTSNGTYRVRYDGGYFLNGRDVPQALSEQWFSPALEELGSASVLLHESTAALGVYICDHIPLVSDSAEPGDEIVCGDCSDLVDAGAEIKRVSSEGHRHVPETAYAN